VRRRPPTVLASTLLAVGLVVSGAGAGRGPGPPAGSLPAVVVAAPGAAGWVSLLRAGGASARAGPLADGLARGALVVPAGAALDAAARERVRAAVAAGGRLVTADPELLRALGFRLGPSRSVRAVRERGVAGLVRWPAARAVTPLRASPALRGFEPLARNGPSVVLASARLGQGRVLAAGLDPFAGGLGGWEALPLLGREAAAATGAPPGPRREAVEVYLDPGTTSLGVEELASRLRGVRAVLLAGWNSDFLDPAANYPYDRLIDALHARGVLVYAWLEPPFVSLASWTQHPECRERTSAGGEAVDDWRRLLALEDPPCFELAWGVWRDLLARHDFDGVDVAELYYPSPAVPWSAAALAEFGRDPAAEPEAWLDFREGLVARLARELLGRIRSLDPALDLELTVIDDRLDPALGRRVGSDVGRLAEVARAAGASLQVEDPYTAWTRGPARYDELSRRTAALMPSGRLLFDLNVVPREYAYPTATMTGAELDLSVAAAARSTGRLAVYSAATVLPGDLDRLAAAAGAAASTRDGVVSAPWSVAVSSPSPSLGRLAVDGAPWPAAGGRALIPAGRHALAWSAGQDERPALLRLAGELRSERATAASLELSYSAPATAWAVVSRRPSAVELDGAALAADPVANPGGGFTLRLPAGAHEVRLGFARGANTT